jgi:enamine deaminase RidA (YjgF/YER057c/UK114 family)
MPPVAGGRRWGPTDDGVEQPSYINPGTLAQLDGFSHAVKIGRLVYVSGQVALDSTGQLVGPGDLRAQARQAFANLSLVLRIARAVPADVAKMTIYVVHYKPGDGDIIREAGAEYFPLRNPPAGEVVGVETLPREGFLIAIDATAQISGFRAERGGNAER